MPILETLAANSVGSVVNAGLGLMLGGYNDSRQIRQQEKLQEMQIRGNKQMADYQQQKQLEMWEKTNYSAQKEQLQKAGLNPGLMYGMGGGGGATIGGGAGGVSGGNAPSGGGEVQGLVGMGIQSALLDAQRRNIDADTKLKETEAAKKAGVDTELTKAQTENTVLQQVITKYTGQEQKDVYEQITSPNRGIQAKTYEDELGARQGVAGTIYELWQEGKLKEKSVAEIEGILLQNAKTREETRKIYKDMELLEQNIKGAKLDNIIKDLEAKLQTDTGIDRSSPTWMKVLGRLFVTLFNGNISNIKY